MVLIDIKLRECNLQRNTAFIYIVGDCLFDSTSYLLQYEISSTSLRMNTMGHLSQFLSLNSPKAQQIRQLELNPDWLHDLHEDVYNEYQYMQKMYVSVVRGGLWGDFTAIKWIANYFKKPIYVWSIASGQIIAKERCEFELEPLHIVFGNNHFEPIEKLNQNMPIILPSEDRNIEVINLEPNVVNTYNLFDSQNTNIEIINLESNVSYESKVSYEPNPSDSQKTWMQQMSLESSMCKPDSIPQVVQLDIQAITMNIHKHERTTVIHKNIIENDACNRMLIESKMRKNNNHNIESNISNSNQNIISNINKKKRRMFWSAKLNAVLTTLLSQCTTNNEIASRFLSQKPELNLTFDQVVRHIRKLKFGQIKNKSNPI
jgi:hypothetical protein